MNLSIRDDSFTAVPMSSLCQSICRLDHLVVCAADLASAVDWFDRKSGVTLPVGGRHPLMGTHNHLSALTATAFLEIIAVDPQTNGPGSGRQRWYRLDDAEYQQQLTVAPLLCTWVVAVNDLDQALQCVADCGIDAGQPLLQTRGDLQWRIGLRANGSLACDGLFPVLIEWPPGINPVDSMQDQQIRLQSLRLRHPQADAIEAGLLALGLDEESRTRVRMETGASRIEAELTADGHAFSL